MATSDAPISIGTVTLKVVDGERSAAFYESKLGLDRISGYGERTTLGRGDTPLLHLLEDRSARRRPKEAGLFHTAFLLPSPSDLGAWLEHATRAGVRLDGAADHGVSQALYLHDPEGNGIEIYADRSRSEWVRSGNEIQMGTQPLDLRQLLSGSDGPWRGLPTGSVIGHVHLQVGDLAGADSFYRDELGFDRTARAAGASFYGSGGYHHHLAANTWNSLGAGHRTQGAAGLVDVELLASSDALQGPEHIDPWGIRFRVSEVPRPVA